MRFMLYHQAVHSVGGEEERGHPFLGQRWHALVCGWTAFSHAEKHVLVTCSLNALRMFSDYLNLLPVSR